MIIEWVHTQENNRQSQTGLEANFIKLNNQCGKVLGLLKVGFRLTVRDAILSHGIGDLRRRVKDLRDKGIDIKDEIKPGGFKEYFL
jgi:hypothetical protein